MATAAEQNSRVPVICADESTIASAKIFSPNSWSGASKGIVQSCWTEYSVLDHCVGQIKSICGASEHLCQKHIETILQQWRVQKFDLQKVVIFSQLPDLHLCIEAFFSGVKTLLDLLVQLLTSEKVVIGAIDGFHRTKNIYGGKVLNALAKNASSSRQQIATRMQELINEHKTLWIDQAILARDQFIHPEKGIYQLMFQLEFTEQRDNLVCVKASPPVINSEAIDQYAKRVLKHMEVFASKFLGLFHDGNSV
jgi:hypothetical protein